MITQSEIKNAANSIIIFPTSMKKIVADLTKKQGLIILHNEVLANRLNPVAVVRKQSTFNNKFRFISMYAVYLKFNYLTTRMFFLYDLYRYFWNITQLSILKTLLRRF